MKLSPFRVSFDGPLQRRERWRARFVVTTLGGVVLFFAFVAMTALLNASSGVIGAWTNAKPSEKPFEERATTGVASPVDIPERTGTANAGAGRIATTEQKAVLAPASKAGPPPRDLRKPKARVEAKPKAKAQAKPTRRAPSQRLWADDEASRARANARTERQWNERSRAIELRSMGRGPFGEP